MTLRVTPPAPFSTQPPTPPRIGLRASLFTAPPMQDKPVRVAVATALASIASVASTILLSGAL